jgi:signal transduction histidine kinase/putative methionine-R-sulfoxide reductase with GAF domain
MLDVNTALEILSRISAEFQQVTDLARIGQIVGEAVACTDVQLWRADEAGLELLAYTTLQPHETCIAYGQGVVGTSAAKRETIVVSGQSAQLGVPLLMQGRLIGVLLVAEADHEFPVSDVRLVEACAYQVAAAMTQAQLTSENTQLRQALTSEQDRLLHIQVALRQMLEESDMRANLVEVAEALQALGWRRVILALYTPDLSVEQMITRGILLSEERALRMNILPENIWNQFLAGELESCRISGLYYLAVGQSGLWHEGDLLFAPLRLGQGRIVGMLRVEDPIDRERPTVELLRPLDILVSQAAYVVENARLLEDAARSASALAEQVDELSMIHRADRELSAHLNMDRVLTLTMDWALRRSGADTGLLALTTDDRRGLVPLITMGYLDRQILNYNAQNPWPADQGILGRAAQTGQTQVMRHVADNDEYARFVPGARSIICIPLSMRGEVLGVITLASTDPEAFEDPEASFLERLARRAAVALDNARLFRQSEQLADDMAVLYSASRAITSTLERDEVLQRIAQSMTMALECSSTLILNYNREVQKTEVLAVYKLGTARDALEVLPQIGTVMLLEQFPSVINAVARNRSIILRSIDPNLSPGEVRTLVDYKIHAMMVIPLVAQEELLGLAVTIEGRRDRQFTSSEIFKAEALASQASVALRQSMLYNEVLELEKIKSEMIRMASHDLRNPLNNILGYVELIAVSVGVDGLTPDQEEYIDSLRRSAKTMQSLIDDLLTLERAASERETEWQVFDLNGLIYEVVEAERPGALLKHQQLHLQRQPAQVLVFGSVTQLRQAIANLVGNAIKYTPDEGAVEVGFVCEKSRLQFNVKDNGYGISPERQVRIFERFYRAREPGTDHIPGTGLGLSLVKTVIERHGGQVWFESQLGKGSTFGFWLPAADPENH